MMQETCCTFHVKIYHIENLQSLYIEKWVNCVMYMLSTYKRKYKNTHQINK